MRFSRCALLGLLVLPGCSAWFFSGESWIDRTRPAVLVETTGGVEFGVTTEFGVLTLGRTAVEGPCRVHYFLGQTPLVESGTLGAAGGMFTSADIDLKTQAVRCLDRAPVAEDRLLAMWTADGITTTTVPVQLAQLPGVEGDALAVPAQPLPAGACILRVGDDDTVQFVGLVSGKATFTHSDRITECYVFAGVDRVREMLAVPRQHPTDQAPRFRPDDITVMKAVKQKEPAPKQPAPQDLAPQDLAPKGGAPKQSPPPR